MIKKAVMVAMVLVWLASLAFGSDVTQTTVRNGYIVNPDNVTISMDGNTTSVVIGQNVQFMLGGNKTGTVTAAGVAGTAAEGYVVCTDSTGWLDTSMMVEGLYNATYEEYWELLAVQTPVMDLRFKVGTKEVSSIVQGTPLRVDFTSNLDENDCVDLVVITPEGYRLTQNPADPDQKFDDINVSQLLEYGSMNESKQINTTGWKVGTYTFSVRTEGENARGLDACSAERTLAIFNDTGLYTIKVTDATGGLDDTVDISVSDLELNASISKSTVTPGDSFEVYGNASSDYVEIVAISPEGGTGTGLDGLYGVLIYTVPTFIPANSSSNSGVIMEENEIEINVSEKEIVFDMPSTFVIGDNITINGSANTGNTVDIALDDIRASKIIIDAIDIPIENGTFYTEISTEGCCTGSYTIEGFIDRNFSVGEDVSGEKSDGNTTIIIIAPDLTANLSTNITQPGETPVINGTATGTDYVDIITISPSGGDGTGLYEKSYPGVPGITTESVHVKADDTFSRIINVSEHADVGKYVIWVSLPGRDGCYGSEGDVNNASDIINHIIDEYCGGDADGLRTKTQDWILAILRDTTIEMAGSDDLACIMELTVGCPGYNFYKKIKVDSGADTGNYTILVLSPGMDGVYGNSSYKYIDSILDLDGAGPELGAIDVSNMTKEQIVSIVKDATVNQAGSDDLIWAGHLKVYPPKIIYVDDDFADDPANHRWNTIKEGINDANDDDTIIVRDGTYTENVDVNKQVTIRSENGSASTIVQAANLDDHVFEVTADYVNISGFTVKGAEYKAGIYLYAADCCLITNNTASNNFIGIHLSYSNNNILINNNANSNKAGIYLRESSNNILGHNYASHNSGSGIILGGTGNTITSNNISNNGDGIHLWSSSNNIIIDNTFTNDGLFVHSSYQNRVENNTVNGKPLVYIEDESGIEVEDAGQVILVDCSNIKIKGLNLSNTDVGIELWNVTDSEITSNSISDNDEGIYLSFSSNNTITSNNISNNGDGIHLWSSSNNKIYLNDFIENSNVYSISSMTSGDGGGGGAPPDSYNNVWNSTEKITYTYNDTEYTNYLGNYWSDYIGTDSNGDGIGDTPYSIDSDQDYHPLKEPFENYFKSAENIFDSGKSSNPYPSISGSHNGTITPNQTINVSQLYTYSCEGTGGHTEYAAFYYTNGTLIAEAYWHGYVGDWHNISFNASFTLEAGVEYNYTLRTGSYPQIHHTDRLETVTGVITCTEFSDANRKSVKDGIPAIRLFL